MRENLNNNLSMFASICFGSVIYAFATNYFIFPHDVILGGTSGISVILNHLLSLSAGKYLVLLNMFLLILGLFILGKEMAVRTMLGSTITTIAIGAFDVLPPSEGPWIENSVVSTMIGSGLIAIASGILFYAKSSSGGTDIIALIVQKYSSLHIGRCLFLTDILIVALGCIWSGSKVIVASIVGFLIKVFGIDFIISRINKILLGKLIKARKGKQKGKNTT